MEDQCDSIFINHNLITQLQDEHISEVAGSSNNDSKNMPNYFYLKPKLFSALSSVGAIYKPYTFKEVLSLLKAYIFEKKALDPEDSRFVLCSNTDLGHAFGVDRFEYSQVRTLISQNLNIASDIKFCVPKVPDIQSGPESEYSYQGYDTAERDDSDCDANESNVEETEYELVTESETENKDPNDSESDVESIILIVGLGESENSDEEWFADESDSSSPCGSESEENSTDDERDQWSCVSCGIKNKPFMRYCQKCWKVRKDWYPEPPKRRRKRKTRPKKDKKKVSLQQKNLESTKLCSVEKGSEETIPLSELERTSSTASSCTVSSTSSSSSLFTLSSQDSGFGSQDLNSFEVISVRKRKNSDAEEGKKKARTVFESNDDSVKKKLSQKLQKFSNSVEGQRWLNSSKAKELLDMLDHVSSDSDTEDLTPQGYCTLCCTRPKNASIIHGRLSHIGFCYPCAKRLFNSKAKCPICRRKIHMITKNSYV